MLDALRKGAGTWVAKLFIALLIFSFAVWGVSGFLTGVGQNTAAKVGDTEVTLFRSGQGISAGPQPHQPAIRTPADPDGRRNAGCIPQQTLGKLIAEAALNDTAKERQTRRLRRTAGPDHSERPGLSGSERAL